MTDLKPDHPAVRAANMGVQEWLAGDGPFDDDPVRLAHDMTAVCLNAAREHYTADDLRDTPAGRELMAETWQEGAMDHAAATSRMTPETRRIINELMKAANPYLERNA